ncbi:MAG: cohesin domain-containing protein [Anaerolineaceae bacterium]|nr:cohesin domain-containing protein [Anaerolineaceae bacterium]
MILKNLRAPTLIFLGLMTGLALLSNVNLTPGIVKAQTETLVRIEPESRSILLNATTAVDIQVIDGVNINAFDLKITYDADILLLESWSLGDYLSNLAQVKKEQAAGLLRLVYTQLATPPVSGDGILLHLVFKGLSVGNSPVVIEAISFADSAGNLTYPETSDGVIIVQLNTSPTATPTITQTLTRTPTKTNTQNPQPSETGTLITPSKTLTSSLPEATFTNTPETTEMVTEATSTTEGENLDDNELMSGTTPATSPPQPEGSLINGGGESTKKSPELVENGVRNDDKNEMINKVLWALLILFVLILAIMVFILIKRKNTEHLKEW